jgi:hypothetical protein
MERVATALGMLGLAAAIGGLTVGELVVAEGLTAQASLIDANLAKTLAAPLHLRCAEIALVGCILLALATPRWIASRFATTLALVAVGCAGLARLVILPRLYGAWAQVDLVARRPAERIAAATELADHATLVAATMAGLLVMLVGLAAWPRLPSKQSQGSAATPSPAASVATPSPAIT